MTPRRLLVTGSLAAVVLGGGTLALVSLVDDLWHLPSLPRLSVQIAVVLITLWVLQVTVTRL